MTIPIAREVVPFLAGCLAVFGLAGVAFRVLGKRRTALLFYALAVVSAAFMLFFFRDPSRVSPDEADAILAGADGVVMAVKDVREDDFLETNSVRISIFLSLLDVHVNRSPIAGEVRYLAYVPGRRYFTFMEKSSEFNQHSVILIDGAGTTCLVKQIVGPVARRVVYWLEPGQHVKAGERIGMMKFGSRLDMYFPKSDVDVLTKAGDRVRAGVTVIGRLRRIQPDGNAARAGSAPETESGQSNPGENP